jgi:hypothetical protein
MTVRRLVVFSGFDTKVIEPAKVALNANQTKVIFVPIGGGITSQYFELLLNSTLTFIDEALSAGGTKIIGLVASSIESGAALDLEKRAFFPAFRRLAFPSAFGKDRSRVNEIVASLISKFTSDDFLETYRYVKPPTAVLSLPLLNANSRRLFSDMMDLYELKSFRPSGSVDKEVVRMRRGRGLRIKGIDFAGCVNDDTHPIRRCTDSILCDVSARLRLGFSLPSRFEFDVSCEQGIAGKEFRLCDGTTQKIPVWADHLNMRINDDFKCGQKA